MTKLNNVYFSLRQNPLKSDMFLGATFLNSTSFSILPKKLHTIIIPDTYEEVNLPSPIRIYTSLGATTEGQL